MNKKGILLINLGTPDSPSEADVKRYLDEFLMDKRVIDINPLMRALLVKGIIVPFRGAKSAKLYQKIWSDENGSPLMYYSRLQKQLLQEHLGDDYTVELAMRYQNPSIELALNNFKLKQVESIRIIPLFPQYSSACAGSIYDKVMEIVKEWPVIPNLSFINSFHNNVLMINAFAENGLNHHPETYDHVLFSFHGLPERHLIKSDSSQHHCLKKQGCCTVMGDHNRFCYSAQCYQTARLIAEKAGIPEEKYTVCFQSRLGKNPWIKPYTGEEIARLANEGKKRLLVFCPAFVADCLETLYEIKEEYQEAFKQLGGEEIKLVESLNDSPKWIASLAQLSTSVTY